MSEKGFPYETEQIIQELQVVYDDLKESCKYEPVGISEIEAPDITVLWFMVCLDPNANGYGRGIGAFVYANKDVYQFHYNIHTPHSKGPHLSNQMTSIDQVVLDTRHSITSTKTIETTFFQKAFWMHTSDNCLNEQEKSLRALIKSLQTYCRKENLCAKLRKTDVLYEKRMMEQRARFLMENTTYGVTRAGMTLAATHEMVTDTQNAMYGVIEEPDPLKGMTRNERKLAMNTGAGVLPEQKLIMNGVLPEQKGV